MKLPRNLSSRISINSTSLLLAVVLPTALALPAHSQSCGQVVDLNSIAVADSSGPAPAIGDFPFSKDQEFVHFGGHWYFSAKNVATGTELYRTDGTPGGTTLFLDIWPGEKSGLPLQLTVAAGSLWFSASTEAHGRELWKSDGTVAGTTLLKDISLGGGDSNPIAPIPLGGKVYFSAYDSAHGTELWSTDGTSSGTQLVVDIRPGGWGAVYAPSMVLDPSGTKLLFAANDGIVGLGLWESDGTALGTKLLADIEPGPVSSSPTDLTVALGTVFSGPTPWLREVSFGRLMERQREPASSPTWLWVSPTRHPGWEIPLSWEASSTSRPRDPTAWNSSRPMAPRPGPRKSST